MSQIKKFYNNGWKKFAETNDDAKSIPTSFKDVSGDTLNVEDVLANQQADIDKLKKNVAWLALHGGGGSGGGGTGGTTTAKATILVNSLASGATINLSENMDLPVVLNNIRPLTASPTWSVTVTIGSTTVLSTQMTYLSNSATIPYSRIKNYVSSSKSQVLTVNATYTDDDNAVYGSATWNGTIRIAAINLDYSSNNTPTDGELVYDITEYNNYKEYYLNRAGAEKCMCPSLIFDYSTPIISEDEEDTFTFTIKATNSKGTVVTLTKSDLLITDEATHQMSVYLCKIKDADKAEITGDYVEGLISNGFTTASDTYKIEVSIKKNKEDLSNSLTFNFLIDDGNIHISTSDVSIDSNTGTEVTVDSPILSVPFIAYYNSTGVISYKYTIRAYYEKDLAGNYTDNYSEIVSESNGTFGVQQTPYCIFRDFSWINSAVTNKDIIKVQIKVVSSEGDKSATADVYVKLTEATESYITLSDDAMEHLLVDFRADKYASVKDCADMVLTTNTYKYGSYENSTVCTDLVFSRANNISGMNFLDDTKQPFLRMSNGTYATLKNCRVCMTDSEKVLGATVASTQQKDILPRPAKLQDGWTVSICYKPDYHADDNRTVFMCGTVLNHEESNDGGTLNTGIAIDVHGVYVGSKRVAVLTDNTINIVNLVYQKTTSKFQDDNNVWHTEDKWYLKVYVDGVLTAIVKDVDVSFTDATCFLGGRQWIDDKNNNNQSWLCDHRLYALQIFDTPLNDLDILGCYINNKIVSNYTSSGKPYYAFKNKELPASFCQQQGAFLSDGVTANPDAGKIKSFIYGTNGFEITNLIASETTASATAGILVNTETTMEQAKALGIPIVQLDVSGNNGWSFDDFSQQLSVSDGLTDTTGDLYYWDPTSSQQSIIQIPGVTIGIQGTSTKTDTVKNLNITMPVNSSDSSIKPLFTPKDTWLPEDTYTLKADIVDSSHSNNAAIGKCINEVFGYDSTNRVNNTFFPFDENAVKNVYGTTNSEQCYRNKTQPTATLKHTVEGFPVFMIIKFKYTASGSSENSWQTIPVGIYSFNLGRDAVHNLGIKKLTRVRRVDATNTSTYIDADNMPEITAFPAYYANCKFDESTPSDTYWIEEAATMSVSNMKALEAGTTSFPTDLINPYEGDFWQTDPTCLNDIFECRYPDGTSVGDIKNFAVSGDGKADHSLVQLISTLPIETPYTTNNANDIQDTDCSGKYKMSKYDTVNSAYYDYTKDGVQQYIEMTSDTNKYSFNELNQRLNVTNAQKYFCIALLFGLTDNFGKNVSYRCWNGGAYYPEFYDLDTAFGGSNQGILNVSPALWMKFLNNADTSTSYGNIYETYDETKNYGYSTTSTEEDEAAVSNIESFHNKLWLSLDTHFMRTLANRTYSMYSEYWFALRKYLDDYAKAYSPAGSTESYENFLDFFMDVYYKTQTGSCGSLLFNYDYRLKYLLIFNTIGDGTSDVITNTSALSKLHGRKIDYTRMWLKEHLAFTDSAMKWRAKKQDVNNYTKLFQNDINSLSLITTTNTPASFPIKTNKTVVIYNDCQGDSGFVLAPKNSKVYIHTGNHGTNSEYNLQFDNIPSVIEFGDTEYRLKDLNVTKFSHTTTGLGPIDVADGFSSITKLDFGQNTKFTTGFDISSCTVGDYSELREVDFSETKGNGATFELNLTTSSNDGATKYRKINYIDIHNSTFISGIKIPAIPLIYLDVTNSLITTFTLKDQYYLNEVSLDGCDKLTYIEINNCNCFSNTITIDGRTNLTTINIANCANIKSLVIKNCASLQKISIESCENLESVYINNCKALTGISKSDNYVNILNNNNLKILNVSNNNNLQRVYFSHKAIDKLTTFNIYATKIKSIVGSYKKAAQADEEMTSFNSMYYDVDAYTFSASNATEINADSNCNVLDLRGCTALTSFNCQNDTNVVCVLFRNEKNNPFVISTNFSGCSALRRVMGHIKINCGSCFKSCKNFKLLNPNDTTWNGVYIKDTNGRIRTFWEMSAIKYDSATDNTTTANCESLIDAHADEFTADDGSVYFQNNDFIENSGTYGLVTNLTFGSANSVLSETFYDTAVTQVDTYYALYRFALSVTTTGMTASYTFRSNVAMFAWSTGNQPSRYTFYKIGNKITAFSWTFSNAATHLYSPSYKKDSSGHLLDSDGNIVATGSTGVLLDNGLFSHVPNITYIDYMFSGSVVHDNNLFKKSSGTYPIKTFYRWYATVVSDGETGVADANHYDKNRDSYNYFETYNSNFFANQDSTTMGNSVIATDYLSKCGNFETFFNGFQTTTNIEFYSVFTSLWLFNANKCKLPKNVARLRSAFLGKYATGDFNPNNMFVTGCPCSTIVNSFIFTGTYSTYGSKATFRIVPGMFDNLLSLVYIGGSNETEFSDCKCFYGSGISRILCPDYSIDGSQLSWTYSWDELCNGKDDNSSGTTVHTNGLFEKLTKLQYCNYFFTDVTLPTKNIAINDYLDVGVVYNGTEVTTANTVKYNGASAISATYSESDIEFPSTMFAKNINLVKLYAFMYNCQFKYKLTGGGFANCTALANVAYMCATTGHDGKLDSESGKIGATGSIPYKFFYHGETKKTVSYTGIYKSVDPSTQPINYATYQSNLNTLRTKCQNYGKKLTIDYIFTNPSDVLGTPDADGNVTISRYNGKETIAAVWKDASGNTLTKSVCDDSGTVVTDYTLGTWTIFRDSSMTAIGSVNQVIQDSYTEETSFTLNKDGDRTGDLATSIEVTYYPQHQNDVYVEKTFKPATIQNIYKTNNAAATSEDVTCLELLLLKYFDIDYTVSSGDAYNNYIKYYSFLKNASNLYVTYSNSVNYVTEASMTAALSDCGILYDTTSDPTVDTIGYLFGANSLSKQYLSGTAFNYTDVVLDDYEDESTLTTVCEYILRLHNIGKENWMYGIMDISTTSWWYTLYTTNKLQYLYNCFDGQRYLDHYSGTTSKGEDGINGERNSEYCPYNWKYDSANDKWTALTRDTYQYDDSWSFNGNAGRIVDGTNVTYSNWNDSHKYLDDKDAVADNNSITYSSVTVGGDSGLHYMCPPDMFRYCMNSSDTNIQSFFVDCGPTGWTNGGSRALKGRIPPNLLRPLSNITNISGLFANCKGIRCYSIDDVRYFIPPTFFKYAPNIIKLQSTFAYCLIDDSTNLNVFTDLKGASALNIKAIFAGCYWNASGTSGWTVTGLFTAFQINGIACAFCNRGYSLDGNLGNNYGASISETNNYTIVSIPAGIKMSKNFNASRVYNNIKQQYVYGVYTDWPSSQVEDNIPLGIGAPYHS